MNGREKGCYPARSHCSLKPKSRQGKQRQHLRFSGFVFIIGNRFLPLPFGLSFLLMRKVYGVFVCTPTFFARKEIYSQYGMFNLDYSIAADYELMLRFLEKHSISSVYISEILIRMRTGGKSNKSTKNILHANRESYHAWNANNLYINPLCFLLKPLRKIFQYRSIS